MATPTETEVKIQFQGAADDAYRLIQQRGYSVRIARTFEGDQLYDLDGQSLRASDRVLRLREDRDATGTRWLLTYKGPAERKIYKSREEIETEVANGDKLKLLLDRLGYIPTFRYEKYRTTFAKSDEPGVVTVDETPLGVFLELEGPKEWIDSTSTHLGFTPEDYVIASYAKLWAEYSRDRSNVSRDMIFLGRPPEPERKDP